LLFTAGTTTAQETPNWLNTESLSPEAQAWVIANLPSVPPYIRTQIENFPTPASQPVNVFLDTVNVRVGDTFTVSIRVDPTTPTTNKNCLAYNTVVKFKDNFIRGDSASTVGTISEKFGSPTVSILDSLMIIGNSGPTPLEDSGRLVDLHFTAIAAGTSGLLFLGYQWNTGIPNAFTTDGLVTIEMVVFVIIVEETVPTTAELRQNYPNPFNPTTNIGFGLSEESWVKLAVYNIQGQEVAILAEEQMLAGQYSVTWNGRNGAGQLLPSGMYIYYIFTDRTMLIKKMMLVK
jgi:hypothetical protein